MTDVVHDNYLWTVPLSIDNKALYELNWFNRKERTGRGKIIDGKIMKNLILADLAFLFSWVDHYMRARTK